MISDLFVLPEPSLNRLSRHLQAYLELRHRLGFKLVEPEHLLRKFVAFVQEQKAAFISTDLAFQWATQATDCHPARLAVRLRSIRLFAQYLSGIDSRTEIPPLGLLSQRYQRVTPHLYSDIEVARLIKAAENLPGPTPLRAGTYSTLFGLLAVTGMRVGEAIRLERGDVDPERQLLTALIGCRHYGAASNRKTSTCRITPTVWRPSVAWRVGSANTTPRVPIRHWDMQRRENCITRPSRMGPSPPPGGGNSHRGVTASSPPFAPSP